MPFFPRSSNKKETIKHKEFVKMYALRAGISEEEASLQITHFVETVFDGMKDHRPITVENFGNFFISEHKDSVAFRFKFKAILGWSSTFKGEL